MTEKDLRKTEIFRDGKWEPFSFRELKKGDRFRLIQDDEFVVSEEGFIAHSDPGPTKENPQVWGIAGKPFKE